MKVVYAQHFEQRFNERIVSEWERENGPGSSFGLLEKFKAAIEKQAAMYSAYHEGAKYSTEQYKINVLEKYRVAGKANEKVFLVTTVYKKNQNVDVVVGSDGRMYGNFKKFENKITIKDLKREVVKQVGAVLYVQGYDTIIVYMKQNNGKYKSIGRMTLLKKKKENQVA